MELQLRPLRVEDEGQFVAACHELAAEDFEFGMQWAAEMDFSSFVAELRDEEAGVVAHPGFVPSTFRVAVVGDDLVGRVSIRHSLTPRLASVGGHVGYAVRPAFRRKGFATEVLRQSLSIARGLDIDPALVTCDEANEGSRAVHHPLWWCGGRDGGRRAQRQDEAPLLVPHLMTRPGYGSPHPSLAPWLAGQRPLSTELVRWSTGDLDLATYACQALPPPELIVSVRCLVTVRGQVLLCHGDQGDRYVWPGGRMEPGETWQQTAAREVREETGWDLDVASLRIVGFLHFHHRTPMPADHPYPHPDFLQLLTHGSATGDPVDWADPEGQVLRSHLIDVEALGAEPLTAGERELLRLVLP